MHAVKLVVYGGAAVLTAQSVATGLGIGVVMVLGTYLGKCLLARLPAHVFPLLVEAILAISGLQLLGVPFGRAATVAAAAPLASAVFLPTGALAHESRTIGGGNLPAGSTGTVSQPWCSHHTRGAQRAAARPTVTPQADNGRPGRRWPPSGQR